MPGSPILKDVFCSWRVAGPPPELHVRVQVSVPHERITHVRLMNDNHQLLQFSAEAAVNAPYVHPVVVQGAYSFVLQVVVEKDGEWLVCPSSHLLVLCDFRWSQYAMFLRQPPDDITHTCVTVPYPISESGGSRREEVSFAV